MKQIFISIISLLFWMIPFFGLSQTKSEPMKAWIELDLTEDKDANIQAFFFNNSNQSLTLFYKLKVERTGKSGTATNNQSGEFSTFPNETKLLSKVEFYAGSRNYYKVLLEIYDEVSLIMVDSLIYGKNPKASTIVSKTKNIDTEAHTRIPTTKKNIEKAVPKSNTTTTPKEEIVSAQISPATVSTKKPTKKRPIDNLEIDGLILDETRSKIARDFYDIFYKKWVAPIKASNYTILIKELPSRGRGAQIAVYINDDELFQRFVPPQQETIELVANFAIRQVRYQLQKSVDVQNAIENEDAKGSGLF